ncbi:MAG: hypothetical protein KC502_05275 [Myxococcales bacterium]|nr:hypothetical protein [Myxococcales bacterium]
MVPRTRRRIVRAGLTVMVTFVALCSGGCDSSNVLGGVWRAVGPPTGDVLIGRGLGGKSRPGVELVLGQYGSSVSGLLRFYRSPDYDVPRQAAAPSFECACAFVHNGTWNADSDRLSFTLNGCLPGAATKEQLFVRGNFVLDPGNSSVMTGTIAVEQLPSRLYQREQEWTFERVEGVSQSDLACERPVHADDGNVANGQ